MADNAFDTFIKSTNLTYDDLRRGASIVDPPREEITGYTIMGRTHVLCGITCDCHEPAYRKARTQELLDIVNL